MWINTIGTPLRCEFSKLILVVGAKINAQSDGIVVYTEEDLKKLHFKQEGQRRCNGK